MTACQECRECLDQLVHPVPPESSECLDHAHIALHQELLLDINLSGN